MKISAQTTSYYPWGEGCKGWPLQKEGKFTVIEELMPHDTSEKKHFHQDADQFFYCLEGTLGIEISLKSHTLYAGEGLFVKAGLVHKVKNVHPAPARFLVISCPDTQCDRVDIEDETLTAWSVNLTILGKLIENIEV